MLTGRHVVLRPMQPEDVVRQHAFNQDLELYGLDSTYPRGSPLARAQAFYEHRTQADEQRPRSRLRPMASTLGTAD